MPEMQKRRSLVALIIIVASLLFIPLLACNFNLKTETQGKPSITDVTMAKQLDANQKPIDSTVVFDETDTFFCSVKVDNLKPGSRVTVKWYYGEQLLDQFTLTVDTTGSGHLGFNLASQEGRWPAGDYKVEVALNDVLSRTENFLVGPSGEIELPQATPTTSSPGPVIVLTTPSPTTVTIAPSATPIILFVPSLPTSTAVVQIVLPTVAPTGQTGASPSSPGFMGEIAVLGAPSPTAQPEAIAIITVPADSQPAPLQKVQATLPINSPIVGVILARQLDDSQRPVDPTDTFEQTDTFFCSVEVVNLPASSQVTANWYQGSEFLDQFTLTTDTAGSGNLGFNLSSKEEIWPVGNYRVEIELNGAPVMEAAFSVKPPNAAISSRVKSATLTKGVDENYRATAPALVFTRNDVIHCSVNTDLGLGSELTAKWYQSGQLLMEYITTVAAQENMIDTYIDFYLSPSSPLEPGPYSIEILLDGQLSRAIDFNVQGDSATAIPIQPSPIQPQPSPLTLPESVEPSAEIAIPESQIGPINFSIEGLTSQQPLLPRAVFPTGTKTIYATFSYSDFRRGDIFEQVWYLNGQESGRGSFAWADALTGQYQGSLNNERGLLSGSYRLDIKLNGQLLGSGQFMVEGVSSPPAMEPTTPPTQPAPAVAIRPKTPTPQQPARQFKIVYSATQGDVHSLWTINLDGTNRSMLTDHASDPAWSPDGNAIVFYGWDGHPRGGSGVYEISTDGTSTSQIWNQGSAEYLDWSPAGRYIAMNTITGTPNKRLVVYDRDTQTSQDLGPGEQPGFSPDGNSIVARTCVGSNCGLFLMGKYGENKMRLTASADDAMPSWSPAGDRIAYASQQSGNWDIWVVNSNGGGQTRLTEDPGIDAMPIWLPDGSGIAFRSTRDGAWGIWVMDIDGNNPRKITDAPAAADWGRDRLDVY